jgi:hypothetical protein
MGHLDRQASIQDLVWPERHSPALCYNAASYSQGGIGVLFNCKVVCGQETSCLHVHNWLSCWLGRSRVGDDVTVSRRTCLDVKVRFRSAGVETNPCPVIPGTAIT